MFFIENNESILKFHIAPLSCDVDFNVLMYNFNVQLNFLLNVMIFPIHVFSDGLFAIFLCRQILSYATCSCFFKLTMKIYILNCKYL